jgi:hypothetical protein
MCVENFGTFDNLLIDNGKDFKSYWFAGSAWKNRKMKLDGTRSSERGGGW